MKNKFLHGLAAFIICSQMAPDFIDSLLYTPEEMDIVKLL